MNADTKIKMVSPPRLFITLLKGFNTTASRVHLILIPLVVDLVLWLGPKLRLKNLLQPLMNDMTGNLLRFSPTDLQEMATASQSVWQQWLDQFNMLTLIRTFPVGVPSLIARYTPLESPLGSGWIYEIPSLRIGLGVLGLLLVIGFFLGTLYFNSISRHTLEDPEKFAWKPLFGQYFQSILMFMVLIALAVMVTLPILIVISLLSMVSPGLGQFFILITGFLAFWVLFPLLFSPHGIFALEQKAFPSMLLSVRMIRFFLPGAGLFFLFSALISEGMNALWTLPEANSWLTLAGIGGHSFVITALFTASFFYYRDGLRWMQFNIQRMTESQRKPQDGGAPVDQ